MGVPCGANIKNLGASGCVWVSLFSTNFKILPLRGNDMILGMDWLEDHRPMSVHWAKKWMKIEYGNR
jgi:hypothetical protein